MAHKVDCIDIYNFLNLYLTYSITKTNKFYVSKAVRIQNINKLILYDYREKVFFGVEFFDSAPADIQLNYPFKDNLYSFPIFKPQDFSFIEQK